MIGNAEKVEAGSIPCIQVSIIRSAAREIDGATTVRILRVAVQLPIIDMYSVKRYMEYLWLIKI
jgi:hypothetical protein